MQLYDIIHNTKRSADCNNIIINEMCCINFILIYDVVFNGSIKLKSEIQHNRISIK